MSEVWKARGNAHFEADEIEDAIACYTKAIVRAIYTNNILHF